MIKRKDQKGFTLVELIVAVASLSLICVLVLKLFILSGDLNDRSDLKQRAIVIASSLMEEIKTYDDPDMIDQAKEYRSDTELYAMIDMIDVEEGYYDIKITVYDEDKTIYELDGGKYFKGEQRYE